MEIFGELAVYFVSDTRQFEGTDATQVVDKQHELIAWLVGQESAVRVVVIQDLQEHRLDHLWKGKLHPVGPGFVVNAHSDLHFPIRDDILRDSSTRDMDVLQGRTHRRKLSVC